MSEQIYPKAPLAEERSAGPRAQLLPPEELSRWRARDEDPRKDPRFIVLWRRSRASRDAYEESGVA